MRCWTLRLIVGLLMGGVGVWVSVWAALHRPEPPPLAEKTTAAVPKRLPKAVVDATFHNFGILDPSEACRHEFLIRNEGEAPLELRRGGTSCKCTMSYLPPGPIPPGEAVPVAVSSKVDDVKGEFDHRATILTNDPQNPRIELRIVGKIRTLLAADPPNVSVRTRRGQAAEAEVVVYSEVWDGFTLKVAGKDVAWEAEPADQAVLERLGARSAQRLRIKLPPREAGESSRVPLEVTAVPEPATGPSRSLRINVHHTVMRPMELVGQRFNAFLGELQLGVLRPGEGARGRVVLVVRDEPGELNVERIETEPGSLKVDVQPRPREKDKPAVYVIDVEVPRDHPVCSCLSPKGKVSIETDHPGIPKVEFKVSFAVMSR